MTVAVFDVGDTIYYPVYTDPCGKPMTVLDREVIMYRGTGRMFIRYLVGPELLTYIASNMHDNVQNEFDNIVTIVGPEGSGKSHLAYALARAYDPEFDMEEGYVYDYTAFLNKLVNSDFKKGGIYWFDEATNALSNRESMQEDNRKMVQILEMCRSLGLTIILCIPSAERLDKYLREHRIRYMLTALNKSWDEVYTTPSRGFYEFQTKRGDSIDTMKTVAYGTFPQMSGEDKKRYDDIKLKSQKEKFSEIVDKHMSKNKKPSQSEERNLGKDHAIQMLLDRGATVKELADEFGMTEQSIAVMASRWRKHVREMEAEKNGKDE